jgi:exosortase/archaeosortase family protein
MTKRNKKPSLVDHKLLLITGRYFILFLVIFSLPVIYYIFTPLTINPVVFSLRLFYPDVVLADSLDSINNLIIINSVSKVEIVPACVAGSAYLLLLLINFCVPMGIKKRIGSIFLSFAILLVFNIIRIVVFSILYYSNAPFFDFIHKLFWYGISTLFVVFIWFFIVKIFSIKEIPLYTDFNYFYKSIKYKDKR